MASAPFVLLRPRWTAPLGALLLAACGAGEAEVALRHPHDVHRQPGFVASPGFAPVEEEVRSVRQALSLEGDILLFEGDSRYVSSSAPGEFGLTEDNQRAIIEDAYTLVADRFDTLVIFTAFEDHAPANRAYYQPVANQVSGIGLQLFDQRADYGLAEGGRLSGYVGMNSPAIWEAGSLNGALASRLASRWAFYLKFKSDAGPVSEALLASPEGGAWSALAQSEGSLLGGNAFERTDDPATPEGLNFYENTGRAQGFAPLDLYAMGRLPKEEVPVLFYLGEATVDGAPVDATSDIPVGAVVRGRTNLVAVEQVVNAMGPRTPSYDKADPYYRVAFAFVTTPGADRADWAAQLQQVEQVRSELPAAWKSWGAGNLCTDVATPCAEPQLALGAWRLDGDADGLVGPNDTVSLRLSLENTGIGTAEGVEVSLSAPFGGATITGGPVSAPAIAQNTSEELSGNFMVTVTSSACGSAVTLRARIVTQEGPVFQGTLALPIGTDTLRFDAVEEDVDWVVDPDGDDTADSGAWALGEPEPIEALGVATQPEGDHTPGEGTLAFMTGPEYGGFFASNDLDDGRTTLQSPVFAIGDALDPILVFYAWRSVWDFALDVPSPLTSAPLIVQVSADGGTTWSELGRLETQTTEWTRVEMRIRDAVTPSNRTRFRFVAEETAGGNTELGIDDVEIVDFLASCKPNDGGNGGGDGGNGGGDGGNSGDEDSGGCTCSTSRSSGLPWLALGLLGLVLRRRRR